MIRKRFHKPNTIGPIPPGRYIGNINYSNKAIIWLVYRERTDGSRIMHARNGREYRPHEIPRLSVGGFRAATSTVYESFGCLFHGHTCLPFRNVTNLGGYNLSERYEKKMTRLIRISSARYTVEVVLECLFDKDILHHHRKMKQHPIVKHAPLNTRDVLYGGRNEAMVLHYAINEGENIQYYDVMSLCPFVCKDFKVPRGHPKFHCVTPVGINKL